MSSYKYLTSLLWKSGLTFPHLFINEENFKDLGLKANIN